MELRKILIIPKDKKGLSIGDIYPVVLTIALVAILIAIVMFVLEEFRDAGATQTYTIENETTADITEIGIRVASGTFCGFQDFAITAVENGTNTITSENYTIDDFGSVYYAGSAGWPNDSSWNITYTYKYDPGAKCSAVDDIVNDFVDFIPWIGIILLVVAAAIVLGILIRSFGGTRTGV